MRIQLLREMREIPHLVAQHRAQHSTARVLFSRKTLLGLFPCFPIQAGKGAEDNAKTYEWCSDQMKAIRQDLTLQNIKDAFAAEVYESHARMALEKVDYSNYKQCQASLQGLYADVSGPPVFCKRSTRTCMQQWR